MSGSILGSILVFASVVAPAEPATPGDSTRAAKTAPASTTKAPKRAASPDRGPTTAPSRSVRPAGKTYPFDRTSAAPVFLVGGEIHIGDGTVIQDGVIEMVGTRIRTVGPSALKASIPAGAEVVDVTGKIVTPGFIAPASNLGLVEIDAEDDTRDDGPSNESAHPIRAAYDAATAINAESSLLQVNAVEGITSAASTPTGGLVSGQVAWIDLTYGNHRTVVTAPSVAVAANAGHAWAGSRPATLAKLRETLADAQFYRRNRAAFDRRQSRDLAAHPLDLAALEPVLAGNRPLVVSASRVSDLRALIALAKDFDLDLVIAGASQAWKIAPELAAADIPVLLQPSRNLPEDFEDIGARLDAAALLHAAGVTIGIGALGDAHNARNLAQEAGIAVANGLPPEAALRAVSLNIAQIYGMEADYGSLATGKVANVVVWDGDPFELSNWPVQVYVRGQAIPMVSRQSLLRDRYLQRSAP